MTWLLYKVRTYFWDLLRNKDLNNIYFTREWIQWEDNRFFNFIFKKTSSDFIYFDRQEKDGLYFSSKLQAYIELARGDKREKETGETLRSELLE